MRYNLNTVDYSTYSSASLLKKLAALRQAQMVAAPEDADDYGDKAEDIWSILYDRPEVDRHVLRQVDMQLAEGV